MKIQYIINYKFRIFFNILFIELQTKLFNLITINLKEINKNIIGLYKQIYFYLIYIP